jgi:striatin 1/3/4
LALSPDTPTAIWSGSSDGSLRLWDLGKKTSLLDLTGHRQKSDEGVCALASHFVLPLFLSSGGDGVVRVWGPPKA